MNLKSIFSALKGPLDLIMQAVHAAQKSGLTHDLIAYALPYIKEANKKFVDNAARREWVVSVLMLKFKCPESIARMAVEMAFKIYKVEVSDKLEG